MKSGSWLAAGLGLALVGQPPSGSQEAEPPPIKRAVAPPSGPYAPGFDALHYDVVLELPGDERALEFFKEILSK